MCLLLSLSLKVPSIQLPKTVRNVDNNRRRLPTKKEMTHSTKRDHKLVFVKKFIGLVDLMTTLLNPASEMQKFYVLRESESETIRLKQPDD